MQLFTWITLFGTWTKQLWTCTTLFSRFLRLVAVTVRLPRDYHVKFSETTFYGGRKHRTRIFLPFSFWTWLQSPKSSTPQKYTCIWNIERVGIIKRKFEKQTNKKTNARSIYWWPFRCRRCRSATTTMTRWILKDCIYVQKKRKKGGCGIKTKTWFTCRIVVLLENGTLSPFVYSRKGTSKGKLTLAKALGKEGALRFPFFLPLMHRELI